MYQIKIKDHITPVFHELLDDILDGNHTHYWLKGGRGSTKSSFAAICVVLLILLDKNANAVVVRKVGNTLRDSVVENVSWAIEELGVSHLFKQLKSPLEHIYIPTGQRIVYRGTDDPSKLKSVKFSKGYPRVVWFEEVDQFKGMEEIRSIRQSLVRGGDTFTLLYSFNPPITVGNWANKACMSSREDTKVHSSTYLDVPKSWLGEQFYYEAEDLKHLSERAYRHEYLGEACGTGGAVFENLKLESVTDEQIKSFDRVYCGVDFGWYPDPWAFVACYYHPAKRIIYVFDEARAIKTGDDETAQIILSKLGGYRHTVRCDVQHTSVNKYRQLGIDARAVKKFAGSVSDSMKWLASRVSIVVDPKRCPNAAEELSQYEYEKDSEGNFCSAYPDKNNHFIDALRYALWQEWKRGH